VSAKSSERGSGAADASAGGSAASSSAVPEAGADVALVCGVSEDGQGVDIIRKRGERLETGTVRRLQQGKPIHGEVVRLRPREKTPLICDVEVEVPAPSRAASAASSGPAQVATESYRKNWDAIYGRGRKPGPLMN
jgi:hypothetical protein